MNWSDQHPALWASLALLVVVAIFLSLDEPDDRGGASRVTP